MAIVSLDSKFMKFMDQFVDLALINVLWVVFSLPLVTLGAATSAACSLILRGLDGDEGPVVRGFWREFRRNLRRGVPLGLVHAVALGALALDVHFLVHTDDPPLVLLVVTFVSTLLVFFAFLYAYPLTARFEASLLRTLQNSVLLSVRSLGRSGLLAGILLLEVSVFTWNTTMLFFGLLVGPMVLLTTISAVAGSLFRELADQDEPQGTSR